MRKEILFSFLLLVLLQCHTAFSLRCYVCTNIMCNNPQTVACQPNQLCVTRVREAGLGVGYRKLGCMNTTECNKDVSEEEAGISISVYNQCCEGELCNLPFTSSAAITRLPLASVIGAVLVLWVTKLF
ncbi:lymphocyte antigen 6D-like [Hyperolius riggenbachi]|uniref:lymphocyte antigen 6D-like n=1 Tax=Hyperolius riggenbachi TaxID=752182 RepID=UPI0035A30B29